LPPLGTLDYDIAVSVSLALGHKKILHGLPACFGVYIFIIFPLAAVVKTAPRPVSAARKKGTVSHLGVNNQAGELRGGRGCTEPFSTHTRTADTTGQ
jgi:hypothetical protein